jgi:hypothetical protein
MTFVPINLKTSPGEWRFENAAGIYFTASGMEGRFELLLDAAADIDRISLKGMQLLSHFLKHEGGFELEEVEVLEAPDDDGASLAIGFRCTNVTDPDGPFFRSYFVVGYKIVDLPGLGTRFWPSKITIHPD